MEVAVPAHTVKIMRQVFSTSNTSSVIVQLVVSLLHLAISRPMSPGKMVGRETQQLAGGHAKVGKLIFASISKYLRSILICETISEWENSYKSVAIVLKAY